LRELVAHLDSDDADPAQAKPNEDLRLLRFGAEGQVASVARMYHSPTAHGKQSEFVEQLKTWDSVVHHQILLVQSEIKTWSSALDIHDSPIPYRWIIEALGFILDIGPDFWLSLITKGRSKVDHAWTDATSFLDVSGDILLLLDGIVGVRPKTGMHPNIHIVPSPVSCLCSLQPEPGIGGLIMCESS
jgi:hypothetical protein